MKKLEVAIIEETDSEFESVFNKYFSNPDDLQKLSSGPLGALYFKANIMDEEDGSTDVIAELVIDCGFKYIIIPTKYL